MIHPNMGTMLGFVTTDIAISKELLQEALRADVQDTFNMISVDGDTSTNDTLLPAVPASISPDFTFASSSIPAIIFSTGICIPITPVEATK